MVVRRGCASSVVSRSHSSRVATAMSGRSEIIPSTPQSNKRWMSSRSFTTHTWSTWPSRCTWRMNAGDTTRMRPACSGTWNATYGRSLIHGHRTHDRCSVHRASSCDALVSRSREIRARIVSIDCWWNDPTQMRSTAPALRIDAPTARASSGSPPFISMMMRASRMLRAGRRRASARRCPGRERDARRRSRSESRHRRARAPRPSGCCTGPVRSVVRSSVVIVNDDGDAVGGELDVDLEAVGAERHAVVDRRHGVLRARARAPPRCGEDQRASRSARADSTRRGMRTPITAEHDSHTALICRAVRVARRRSRSPICRAALLPQGAIGTGWIDLRRSRTCRRRPRATA